MQTEKEFNQKKLDINRKYSTGAVKTRKLTLTGKGTDQESVKKQHLKKNCNISDKVFDS